MKSYLLAASLLGAAVVIGCNPASGPTEGPPAGMTKVVLSVPDMS